MKIAYFVALSVGLTQCLPMAHAAENAQSDKASWITQNIADLKSDRNNLGTKKMYLSQSSLPMSRIMPKARTKSDNSGLRNFVPNRYLPRERDLELASQRGRMDSRYIEGQVSTSNEDSRFNQNSSNYESAYSDKPIYGKDNAVQVISQAIQSVIKKEKASSNVAKVSQFKVNAFKAGRFFEPPELKRQVMPETLMNASSEPELAMAKPSLNWQEINRRMPIVTAPELSQDQSNQLDYLVDSNMPTSNNPAVEGSAGPAPFPLNMLPFNAMQNLDQSRKFHKKPQITARFGSWHSKEALPQGSFQSYAPAPRSNYLSHVPTSYSAQPSRNYSVKSYRQKASSNKQYVSNKVMPQNKSVTVAAYPPYRGQSAVYMF